MDGEVALAIVNEARARGLGLEVEDDQEHATQLVRLAAAAYDKGARGDDIVTIMTMGGLLEATNGEPMDPPSPPVEEAPVVTEELKPPVEFRSGFEGFPIPPDPEGDPPEMPRDLTTISDRECRKLHAEFNAWLTRVIYLLGIEKSDFANAEHLRDQALREAKKRVRAAAGETKISQAEVNSRAEEDEKYEHWLKKLVEHQARMAQLLAFKEIYSGNVERLSRDWRMRVDEFNMTGGGSR